MESPGSSLSLSPVPSPHSQPYFDNITLSTPNHNSQAAIPKLASSASQNAKNTISATTTSNAQPTEKVKKPRKKKEPVPDDGKPKEKKPRKPRASNPDGASARKKQKLADAPTTAVPPQPKSRQPTLSDMMNPQPQQSSLAAMMAPPVKSEPLAPPSIQPPRPISSGQRYDPIRGLIDEPTPPTKSITSTSPQTVQQSNSSNLANLIHPTPPAVVTPKAAPMSSRIDLSSPAIPAPQITSTISRDPAPTKTVLDDSAMDIDPPQVHPSFTTRVPDIPEDKIPSKPASSAPTVKERRSPPRAAGSGLLSSSSLFGGAGSSDDGKSRRGVDINIEIKLNPAGGNTINIAQEIMRKYGRDAINPRAAAHRERLLQVAAAANRLEVSGDEMSVDGDSDKGDDSTADMVLDGQSTAGEGADGDKPRKRRRRKAEDYDKEDDFIDDTEMAWEESAAVAKDGFFVYSGPLVKPEEKTETERSTTSTRGRGRGRGGRGRGGTVVTHASSTAAKAADGSTSSATNGTTTRGRGGRVRGGTTGTRKPKVAKDDSTTKSTADIKSTSETQTRPQEVATKVIPVPAAS